MWQGIQYLADIYGRQITLIERSVLSFYSEGLYWQDLDYPVMSRLLWQFR